MPRFLRRTAVGAFALAIATTPSIVLAADATSASPLDAFNVDLAKTTLSGISAGGYMAQQFHVAYSSIVIGAGIIAGGPFYCAKGNVVTALTDCTTPTALDPPDTAYSIRATDQYAARSSIDAPTNLAGSKVWLFSGTLDRTVYPVVMDRLHDYYLHYVPAANVFYENTIPAAHSMVTDGYGAPCDHQGDENVPTDVFINDCRYDAAGRILAHVYGPLRPKAVAPTGRLVAFPQGEFLPNPTAHSMDTVGHAYIPAACDAGERCRVHVAFHGCLQDPARIGDAFYRHAGYNEWADTNAIIVLYPQTIASPLPPVYNPKACFDWWGYDDPAYATRNGRQMVAVKRMLDRLASGYDTSPPAPPTSVRITTTGDHAATLTWHASRGPRATHYRVYFATPSGSPYAAAGTTDGVGATVTGLASGTGYTFMVRAVGGQDAESADSNQANGTTSGASIPAVTPVTLLVP